MKIILILVKDTCHKSQYILQSQLSHAPWWMYLFNNFDFAVPLVSRMCPSDTYKVWKSGKNLVFQDNTIVADPWLRRYKETKWQACKKGVTTLAPAPDRFHFYKVHHLPSTSVICIPINLDIQLRRNYLLQGTCKPNENMKIWLFYCHGLGGGQVGEKESL